MLLVYVDDARGEGGNVAHRSEVESDVTVVAVLLFAIVALLVPLGIPESHFVWRTIAAYLAIGSLLRFIEVARAPAAFRPGERVAIVLFLTDPRQVHRVQRRVLVRTWVEAVVLGTLGALGLYLAHSLADGAGPFGSAREIERSVVGVAGLLALSEGAQRLLDALAALFGAVLAPVHVAPSRSQSLAAGVLGPALEPRHRRLAAGAVLRAARSASGSRVAGIFAAFVASAIIHLYPTLIVLGAGPAAAIAGFFLAHGSLIAVEAPPPRAAVACRKRPGSRTCTCAFAVTAPLFTEAFLRSIGI